MRVLLIHGARSAPPYLARLDAQLGAWLQALLKRAPSAMGCRWARQQLARIAWAVTSNGRPDEAVMASKG